MMLMATDFSPDTSRVLMAYRMALNEERRLWRAAVSHSENATDRLMSYVRWRAAADRLHELFMAADCGERLNS